VIGRSRKSSAPIYLTYLIGFLKHEVAWDSLVPPAGLLEIFWFDLRIPVKALPPTKPAASVHLLHGPCISPGAVVGHHHRLLMDEQEAFVFSVVQLQSFTPMDPFLDHLIRETAFRFFTVFREIKSIVFKLYVGDTEVT